MRRLVVAVVSLAVLVALLNFSWSLLEVSEEAMAFSARSIGQLVQGQRMMEGAGVMITRTVGTRMLKNLDPFLLLDELKSPANEAAAGFPDHPHRGFSTCTIMITGKMQHKDSAGNQGVIEDGGVQWMTAGRGIVHSEMPVHTGSEPLWGFQLWINLPSSQKMMKPRYQDYQAGDIPTVSNGAGADVRVMAGTFLDTTGPIELTQPGLLMDIKLGAGGTFEHKFPSEWNCFAYVFEGNGWVGTEEAPLQHALVLESGDGIKASSGQGMRFLLIGGKPIGEPIVQHGPFVMNTQKEIMQAFSDYQSGKLQNPDDNVWAAWQ